MSQADAEPEQQAADDSRPAATGPAEPPLKRGRGERKLRTGVVRVHRKALAPVGPDEYPATCPYLLIPFA